MEGIINKCQLDEIDNLEDLLSGNRKKLQVKEKIALNNIKENEIEIKAEEKIIKEKEEKLEEEKILLNSVKNDYFITNRAVKVRDCETTIQTLNSEIKTHRKKLEGLTLAERDYENLKKMINDQEEKLEKLKEEEKIPTEIPWRFILNEECIYNQNVKDHFLHSFRTFDLSKSLSKWKKKDEECSSFVNLILIGSTGCGKSSFINTCTTALQNSGDMVHASVDQIPTLDSATENLNLAPLRCSDTQLPIRLFDCRGIHTGIGHKEMELIIKGNIKPNSKISEASEMEKNAAVYNPDPQLKNKMHCIVYVVKAHMLGTQRMELHESVKEIREVRQIFTKLNIPQCVLVTHMDTIVPDIKQMFHHHIALRYCSRASTSLHMPKKNVFPMSNYFDEGIPTVEKDALALNILWKITCLGRDYVEMQKNRGDILEGFFD